MGTSNAILVAGVGFIIMVIFGHGIVDVFHDPLGMATHITIIRSIMGTVGTTSVMKQVANMGSSFASMSGGTSPGVVLGTCLILAAGVIPVPIRKTPEGIAIYMGTQYAYADLVMAAVPWQGVRIAISAGFVVLGPLIARWHLTSSTDGSGPFSTLVSTLSFVGVSFAVEAVMPMTIGSPYEDVIRGTCAVLLLHAAIGYVPHLGKDVESFASWLVARRFSTILAAYGRVPMAILVGIFLSVINIVKNTTFITSSGEKGGVVMGLIYDLLILVETFIIAAWALEGITPSGGSGSSGTDTGLSIVLMICAMSILVMVLNVYNARS
jgi:hypothetical protein